MQPAPNARFVPLPLLEKSYVRVMTADKKIYDLPAESLGQAQQVFPDLIVLQRA
jgi:hypothetical protein